MSEKVNHGVYRFDRNFRGKLGETDTNKTIDKNILTSTLNGRKEYSIKSEVNEFGFRLKPKKAKRQDANKKDINNEEVSKVADVETSTLIKSVGGKNAESVENAMHDKSIVAPIKEVDALVDKTKANNVNFTANNTSGAFQGGHDKLNALMHKDYKPAIDANVSNSAPVFRMVSKKSRKVVRV